MLTTIDKAIVALLPGLIVWINQTWGWHLNADPAAIGTFVSAVSAILVYFIPNKAV